MSLTKRALISVYDKTGIEDICSKLLLLGYTIVSTGGTRKYLSDRGYQIIDISEITGIPEMLDGRVKTLNNSIYAGILAKRDDETHINDIVKYNIPLFDIVIVNLYPFEQVINDPSRTLDDAIENIDIGGVSLLRASAKNYKYIWCVSNIKQYSRLITGLSLKLDGVLDADNKALTIRREFATNAFNLTSHYDNVINTYLAGDEQLNLHFTKIQNMRYGENPHQQAALYKSTYLDTNDKTGIIYAKQLQGKELSYNNIIDADSALQCASYIASAFPTKYICVIVKHNNPCGVALGDTYLEAYNKAFSCDPTSAFGGIIALYTARCENEMNNMNNNSIEDVIERILSNQFVEVIISNTYSPETLEICKKKQNVRILQSPLLNKYDTYEIKSISGNGILYQSIDNKMITSNDCQCKTIKQPTTDQLDQLLFAWYVAKHVKSNAIVYVKDFMTIGIGAGQMSRIDSTKLAIMKATNAGLSTNDCVVASDAFFPFSDGVESILNSGAIAIIQPGGSIKDKEIITTADKYNSIMIMTGTRHFKH